MFLAPSQHNLLFGNEYLLVPYLLFQNLIYYSAKTDKKTYCTVDKFRIYSNNDSGTKYYQGTSPLSRKEYKNSINHCQKSKLFKGLGLVHADQL